jgi:photosystem II stability/assembly factor-like uncharacterized protein
MSLSRRLSTPLLLALGLVVGVGTGEAQNAQVDPWQVPNLVNSRIFQRWWWEFEQRAYPLADIPADAKSRALRQIEQAKSRAPRTIAGNTWVNIGPAPQTGGQVGLTLFTRPMSGRVAAIAVDPGNGSRWLVGAAQGGVWETRDGGATWSQKTDSQASLSIGAIAFAPSNTNVIYVGTGESNRSADSYSGAGLLKSTDGGNTWTLLAAGTFGRNAFSALKVDPGNSDTVLAASTFGVAGRVNNRPPLRPPTGIHRSTDGGVTWNRTRDGAASDLATDPTNFNHVYGAIGDTFSSTSNNLVRSTDGGQTWDVISGPWTQSQVGRIALAIAPSNPNTLYVAIQRAFGSDGGASEGALLGLFRTNNAWAGTPTFISVPQPPETTTFGFCGFSVAGPEDDRARADGGDEDAGSPEQQCWYDMTVSVDPGNADTLYAGGVALWKCTNCGASPTWAEISKQASSPSQGIHVDQHASVWADSRFIVGNDGGVWSTTDGGNTWADHNTNLSTFQFYDGSLHPTNGNFALGGAQDNGTSNWTGGAAWPLVRGGDGAANAISASNPNTNWAVSSQNLNIARTVNGGASFITATSGIDRDDAPFISRFEKCPANDNVFIAGTTKIWRSTNFFSATPPTWSDNGSGGFNANVSALAFAPSDATCSTYAAGGANGTLRLTTNGGSTWVDLDPSNGVPNRAITDLAFHPTNPNFLYVTLSGFDQNTSGQPGHVFATTNALAASPTWVNISPPVNLPHNTIAIDPTSPNVLYVGTDLGVWTSRNGGGSWGHMGPETGMPNVAVFDLKINPATNRIVAFTHGRGAFVLTSATLTAQATVNPPATFTNGQTLVAGGSVNNTGNPGSADFYVGILRPDFSIQFFTPGGIVIGSLSNLGSFRPAATGIALSTPFVVSQSSFYTHQWVAGDQRGAYIFFIVALRAGALDDGFVSDDEILVLATAPFSVQ